MIAEYHNSDIGSTNSLGVKHCGGSGGYCQYRDEPITDPDTAASIDRDLKTTVGFNVTNTSSSTKRFYIKREGDLNNITLSGDTGNSVTEQVEITAGASDRLELTIVADDNWSCCTDRKFTVQASEVRGPDFGPKVEITVIDDDDKSYIGQRNGHPYDGYKWATTPHCGAGASRSC